MSTGFDIAAAAASFMEREKRRKERRTLLFQKAQEDCARIIDMVVRDFGPTRIRQWGSLLDPVQFDEHSDIDIAVEGLRDARRFLDLVGRTISMTDFPVDIVEWENLDQRSRDSITRRGRVVYEREG